MWANKKQPRRTIIMACKLYFFQYLVYKKNTKTIKLTKMNLNFLQSRVGNPTKMSKLGNKIKINKKLLLDSTQLDFSWP